VLCGHLLSIAVAQHTLQYDADGYRQALDVAEFRGQCGQRVKTAGLAGGRLESLQGESESVGHEISWVTVMSVILQAIILSHDP